MRDTDNWDTKLAEYQKKYKSYLKKSVSGEKDVKLKTEIETLNLQLETMVRNKDNENDNLVNQIETMREEIKVALDKCKKKKETEEKKNSNKKVVNISLSKKLRNIQEKEEDTKNTLFFLKCSIIFFIVCIAITLYFISK
jgi:hypothetical protein